MGTINVRQLDDGVIERLKQRAKANNRSLQGEVRHILERVTGNDMERKRIEFIEMSDRFRRLTAGRKHTPAEVLIREDRDHGH